MRVKTANAYCQSKQVLNIQTKLGSLLRTIKSLLITVESLVITVESLPITVGSIVINCHIAILITVESLVTNCRIESLFITAQSLLITHLKDIRPLKMA